MSDDGEAGEATLIPALTGNVWAAGTESLQDIFLISFHIHHFPPVNSQLPSPANTIHVKSGFILLSK